MHVTRAVILDWAGTTVDYGSRAPVTAFVELFRTQGVHVTEQQARRPMGAAKKDHLRLMMGDRDVAEAWRTVHGYLPDEATVDKVFTGFAAIQQESILAHARVIDGVPELMQWLRSNDIRVGSGTGYARSLMKPLAAEAARQGYEPECIVVPDDVPGGRPAPWLALRAAMLLDAYPMARCVKVGDTVVDMQEGRNAGMWAVGVTLTGNEVGLSKEEVDALPADERIRRMEHAAATLRAAGAHTVIETIADLSRAIEEVERRGAAGERP
ncbi:MAG: phosphonoacetaldehyde hydrolase [Bryobacterales bacterium]|jgi:phosphonoacetaldehyde hydrolase|nr:phosphonoacetaldehyde hydrolase [Bryobacterales bacterium]